MSEDSLHRRRSTTTNPQLEICAEIHNEILISLEDLCVMMTGKMFHELGIHLAAKNSLQYNSESS